MSRPSPSRSIICPPWPFPVTTPGAFQRHQRGQPDDLDGLLLGDRRPDPLHLTNVRMLTAQGEPAVAALATPAVRAQDRRREGPRRGPLADAGRPDEQVGVTRLLGRGLEPGHGSLLADDAGPQPSIAGLRAGHSRGSTAARTAAATSSSSRLPSITIHRFGSGSAATMAR